MTADLQAIAAATPPGSSSRLATKSVSFRILTHNADGTWNTSQVSGLPAPSLKTTGAAPLSLLILPYHQAGAVVSIRQFTDNATNHDHGMQSEERFGVGTDPDGDGFTNELTVADLTAISLFQATLPVPGRVIPNDPAVERAVFLGERLFDQIGCSRCHVDALPLTASNNPGLPGQPGWIYFEPNPYNPAAGPNLRLGPANYPHTAPALTVDLTSDELPPPHLNPMPKASSWCPLTPTSSSTTSAP